MCSWTSSLPPTSRCFSAELPLFWWQSAGCWRRETIGSPAIAAALAGGFAAYSGVTIWAEGLMPVLTNNTSNLWGVQVWWDLLISATIALFLIAPRARAQGMSLPLWAALILATASIGLLAMCARLFWLERAAAAKP